MKKTFILLLFMGMGLIPFEVPGQADDDISDSYRTMVYKNTVAPNTAELQKYVDVPVKPYTGVAEIAIPLYTISYAGMEVPIALNYHPSGIKVSEEASWVGLGWSLAAGGSISRKVVGLPDDLKKTLSFHDSGIVYYGRAHEDVGHLFSPNRINAMISYLNGNSSDQSCSQHYNSVCSNLIARTKQGRRDASPDIFYYNFGGYTGKFVFEEEGKIINLTVSDLTIIPRHGSDKKIIGFDVLTPEGIKYIFESAELTKTYTTGDAGGWLQDGQYNVFSPTYSPGNGYAKSNWDPNSGNRTYISTADFNTYLGNPHNSTWKLSKIVNLNSLEEIVFTYVDEDMITKSPPNIQQTGYEESLPDFDYDEENSFFFPVISSVDHSASQIHGKRLSRISWKGGEVVFLAGSVREDILSGFSSSYPVLNSSNSRRLDRIEVKSHTNDLITKWTFNTTYNLATDYSGSLPTIDKPLYKRLRLNSLIQNQGVSGVQPLTHQFHYYNASLPNKMSNQTDYWGYYKPNTVDGYGLTKLWYYGTDPVSSTRLSRYSIYPRTTYSGSEWIFDHADGDGVIATAVDRSPSLGGTKAESLTGITYPTGVDVTIVNELNTFYLEGKSEKAGGLRIEYIQTDPHMRVDGDDRIYIRRFKYKHENGTDSGRIMALPQFAEHALTGSQDYYRSTFFSLPQNELAMTHGSFVGYEEVEEVFYSGEDDFSPPYRWLGYTKYFYDVPASFGVLQEDWSSTNGEYIYKNTITDYEAFDINMATERSSYHPFPPNPNYDWNRGKLLRKEIYDSQGNLELAEENNYEIKEYQKIPALHSGGGYRGRIGSYYHLAGWNVLHTQTKTQYDYSSGTPKSLSTVYTYEHNSTKHHQLTAKETVDSKSDVLREEYYYPDDVISNSSLPGETITTTDRLNIAQLNKDNRHQRGTVVQTDRLKDGVRIHSQRTLFKNPDNGMMLPEFVKDAKGINALEERVVLGKYDNLGNLLQASKSNGSYVVYVYGYELQYPIAQIEGEMTYDEINNRYMATDGKTLQDLSDYADLDVSASSENTLRSWLTKLRQSLESSGKEVKLMTYTYDPLVGLTSMTDTRGYTVYYQYDAFNRLESIKDSEGNIVSENEYHYKN
ncbi:RHS repeat protein [Muricauda sp. SCSIO 64092]|uniref:RHS repeat domain-containing protein n=1 Tax=Allomuricauda sp. SCSIO 64092 TaxID=2908842 RepID=UPI001FF28B5D|nr:RHS repeat domain-containing protein [Muricauda sp. SCSIO 64092]UOY06001.1 RHS repeat protein [Muricauda sp. SCSIO 64092]